MKKGIPIIQPYDDMVQGFEIMLPLLEKIKDKQQRLELIMCWGQLTSTYNLMVNEINEVEEVLKEAKAHLN
tara:strand:+ start:823 stop:1035 length:213 start_codon:yes stop_codon:yes gene_type:complete